MTRRPLQPGPRPGPIEDLVHTRCRQRRAAPVPLQHHEHPLGRRGRRPLLLQVAAQRREEARRHRHDPLPPALALGDEQALLPSVDILEPQAEHLAASQPTQHHRIDHRPVAMRAQRPHQRIDCDRRQHPRQRSRGTDQRHPTVAAPSAAAPRRQTGRNRVACDAGVTASRQIRIQAAHARQSTGDRARRQTRLAVLQPHHPVAEARFSLLSQEREHVRRGPLGRRLGDTPEEDLQLRRHRQPGIDPGSRRNEGQVLIQQRMPERDRRQLRPTLVTDQARHEHDDLPPRESTPIPSKRGRHADHPHIKHKTATLTLDRYGHLFPDDLAAVAAAFDSAADALRTVGALKVVESCRK